jgi:hypothetical protein
MHLNRHGWHGSASVVLNCPPTLTRNSHLYLQSWQATAMHPWIMCLMLLVM